MLFPAFRTPLPSALDLIPFIIFVLFAILAIQSVNADTVTYEYDELGRLIEVTDTDGNDTDYSFDPAGNRTNQAIVEGPGPLPNFTVSDAQAVEGSNLVFTVTLHSGTGGTYNVDYDLAPNTATTADYVDTSGTLTFSSVTGMSTQTVTVTSVADTDREKANETFYFNLSNETGGAVLGDDQGTGSILTVDSSNRTPEGEYEYFRSAQRFQTFDDEQMIGTDADGDNIIIGNIISQQNLDETYTTISADKKSFSIKLNGQYASFSYIVYEIVDPLGAIGTSCFGVGVVEFEPETQQELPAPAFIPPPNGCPNNDGGGNWQNSADNVSFSINDVSTTEGGDLSFAVTKAGTASQTYSLEYGTEDGTASVLDYVATSGGITFTEGQTVKSVSISTNFDGEAELAETVLVNLSGATGGASISDSQGIGTINNGGPPPDSAAFSVDDVFTTEGGDLSFTVTKSGTATQAYTVDYVTADNTATVADSDYIAIATTTLTFLTGDTEKTVIVSTGDDGTFEPNETMFLNLSNPSGVSTISDSQGIGTINNDDPAPDNASFSIDDVIIDEGGVLSFTVTKSGTASQTYTVDYATANGTAGSGDYTTTSGTLTFISSDPTETVSVQTTQDTDIESDETVLVNLTNPSGTSTISDSQGVGTINDDDTPPDNASFSINDVNIEEGGVLSFTVTKSGTASQTYTVDYATANGTASSNDYTAASGTLTFISSDPTETITVQTTEDTDVESDETVLVNLSNASGTSTISDNQGLGTIDNDDTAPNQPPTAVDDSKTAFEGDIVNYTVLVNDSDPENDPLTITSLSNVDPDVSASISCSNTCVRVNTPVRGIQTLTYHISDGNGGTDSAVLSINVKRDLGLLSIQPEEGTESATEEESGGPEGQ